VREINAASQTQRFPANLSVHSDVTQPQPIRTYLMLSVQLEWNFGPMRFR